MLFDRNLQMGVHAIVELCPTKHQNVLCVQLPLELWEELCKENMLRYQTLDRLTGVFSHPISIFDITVILGIVSAPDGLKEIS